MNLVATTIRTLLMETEVGGRQPTARQFTAIASYVGDSRNSKADALREAGYAPSTVDHPARVFGSPLVKKVLEEIGMPDEREALVSLRRNLNNKSGMVQVAAADKILKVFGSYAPEKSEGKHTMTVGIMSMRELREKMRENGESIVQAEVISVSK
jgi:hypothetical protein